MEDYQFQTKIGDGTYGTVYKAVHKLTGQIVAIKVLKQKIEGHSVELKEIKILKKLKHPNIVQIQRTWISDGLMHMVFDYMENNLFDHYMYHKQIGKTIPEEEIRSIMRQIIDGVAYIHQKGFFHRDLKPENILIHNGVVKICDFGLVRELYSNIPLTEYVSTRWYRAPEIILKNKNYDSAIDIFAIGCIMAELYTFRPLFPGHNEIDQIQKIYQTLGAPDNQWQIGSFVTAGIQSIDNKKSKLMQTLGVPIIMDAYKLIESMLQLNPEKRLSASQLKEQSYFTCIYRGPIQTFEPISALTPNFPDNDDQKTEQSFIESALIMGGLFAKQKKEAQFRLKIQSTPKKPYIQLPTGLKNDREIAVDLSSQVIPPIQYSIQSSSSQQTLQQNEYPAQRKRTNGTFHLPHVVNTKRQLIKANQLNLLSNRNQQPFKVEHINSPHQWNFNSQAQLVDVSSPQLMFIDLPIHVKNKSALMGGVKTKNDNKNFKINEMQKLINRSQGEVKNRRTMFKGVGQLIVNR